MKQVQPEARHQCILYNGAPSEILHTIAVILKRKLEEGHRCLYLNSIPMVAGMRSTLSAIGVDVAGEIAKGSLILSSETVAPGADFNFREMLKTLETAIDDALADGFKGLWATGDMAWEFGDKKDFSKLLEYELGLEEIFRRRKEISGICQYHHDTLPREAMRQGLLTHPAIYINDTLSRINPHYLKADNKGDLNTSVYEMDEMIDSVCRHAATGS